MQSDSISYDLPFRPARLRGASEKRRGSPTAGRALAVLFPRHAVEGLEDTRLEGIFVDSQPPRSAQRTRRPIAPLGAARGWPRGAAGRADRLHERYVHAHRIPRSHHQAGAGHAPPLAGFVDRRHGGRGRGVGPDPVGGDLPPQARRPAASAGPVQPADRDPLHHAAVRADRGALLLHRPGRGLHRHAHVQDRTDRERGRVPVELAVQLPAVQRDRQRRDVPGPAAAARGADRRDRPVQPDLAGRHPLVLGP